MSQAPIQPAARDKRRTAAAATGGVIGALLAASCCLGPLVLVTLGVSGAWIGNLAAMKAYQPVFLPVAVALLAYGFWQVYRARDCDDDAQCAKPASRLWARVVLWLAALLIALAATVDRWAPLFY